MRHDKLYEHWWFLPAVSRQRRDGVENGGLVSVESGEALRAEGG